MTFAYKKHLIIAAAFAALILLNYMFTTLRAEENAPATASQDIIESVADNLEEIKTYNKQGKKQDAINMDDIELIGAVVTDSRFDGGLIKIEFDDARSPLWIRKDNVTTSRKAEINTRCIEIKEADMLGSNFEDTTTLGARGLNNCD